MPIHPFTPLMPRIQSTTDVPAPPSWIAPLILLSFTFAWVVAVVLYLVNFPQDFMWLHALREWMTSLWREGYREISGEEYELAYQEEARSGSGEANSAEEERDQAGEGQENEVVLTASEENGETDELLEKNNVQGKQDEGEVVESRGVLEVIGDGVGYVVDLIAGLTYSGLPEED